MKTAGKAGGFGGGTPPVCNKSQFAVQEERSLEVWGYRSVKVWFLIAPRNLCYPRAGLKGVGAKLVILEEASAL